MRLFLSSYGIGNQPERLRALLKGGTRVLIVTNASDHHDEAGIIERFERNKAEFTDLSLTAERLDLRDYFDKDQKELHDLLEQYDLVWVSGGNTFILRRAMQRSGFDEIITDLLAMDEIVYGGFSAGACVLAPTLMGIDLCDDPNLVPKGYDEQIIWDGLALIDYSIVPHYQSDHPESAILAETIQFLDDQDMPYKTLKDGEALMIIDDEVELLQ